MEARVFAQTLSPSPALSQPYGQITLSSRVSPRLLLLVQTVVVITTQSPLPYSSQQEKLTLRKVPTLENTENSRVRLLKKHAYLLFTLEVLSL
jgi:hypothetical protein